MSVITMDTERIKKIKDMAEEVRRICSGGRYRDLSVFWERFHNQEQVKRVPVIIEFDPLWLAGHLGFDYKELVMGNSPETLIEFQLKQKIFHHRYIPDDTIIKPEISTRPTGIPITDPFGGRYEYHFNTGGWHVLPVVSERSDLGKIPLPHFNSDGYSLRKKETLNRFNDILEGEIMVNYVDPVEEGWFGPLSSAMGVYGMHNFLTDLKDEPKFIQELMQKVTMAKVEYMKERNKIMAEEERNVFWMDYGLGEDEVDCNLISPRDYEEFVFPYDRMEAETYLRCYYHSCGNLTPVLGLIGTLPNLYKVEISPWTDLKTAVQKLPAHVILEKTILPNRDTFEASPADIKKSVTDIISIAYGRLLEIKCDAIMDGNLDRILKWLDIVRQCC